MKCWRITAGNLYKVLAVLAVPHIGASLVLIWGAWEALPGWGLTMLKSAFTAWPVCLALLTLQRRKAGDPKSADVDHYLNHKGQSWHITPESLSRIVSVFVVLHVAMSFIVLWNGEQYQDTSNFEATRIILTIWPILLAAQARIGNG